MTCIDAGGYGIPPTIAAGSWLAAACDKSGIDIGACRRYDGETEVGGFGICREDDLLDVQEFVSVNQRASAVTVAFDEAAVAGWISEPTENAAGSSAQ